MQCYVMFSEIFYYFLMSGQGARRGRPLGQCRGGGRGRGGSAGQDDPGEGTSPSRE